MNVNKLSRLFDALGTSPRKTQQPAETASSKEAAAVASSPAVTVAADFGKAKAEPIPSNEERSARVADIKAKVQAGTYNPDTRDVAKSVLKELFV